MRRRILGGLFAAVATVATQPATAQDYPLRPIRVIVTSSPGSVGDTTLRILRAALEKSLGQALVVENIPGSGGISGTEKVARAPADGYTLGLISNNHVINAHIYRQVPYDSEKDFTPISVIGSTPVALVVHPGVAAASVGDLVALARARPGQLNYGSAGNGTVLHLAGVLFTSEAGVDVRHVPYKSLGQMTTDLLGGQIEMGFSGVATVAQHVKAGKLRALAVSTSVRSSVLPDVPTMAEAGLPGYRFEGWLALVAPARLPKPVADRLHAEVTSALAQKDVQEALRAQGVITSGSSPAAAQRFIRAEMDKHAQLVKRSGAVME